MSAEVQIQQKPHRKRGWRGFGLIVGFAALYVLGEYTIPRFPFGPYTLYSDLTPEQRAAVIPYETLTDEQTVAFSSGLPNFVKTNEVSIIKFPHVRDCLTPSEAAKEKPDLRLINWDKMLSLQDANVCMWRIFTSYEQPERIFSWFEFHGAETNSKVSNLKETPITNFAARPLYFSWRRGYNSWHPLQALSRKTYFSYAIGVSVSLSLEKNEVLGVSTKWAQSF